MHAQPTPIQCSECHNNGYRVASQPTADAAVVVISTTAECEGCGHVVHIALDVESNLDPNERITFTDDGYLAVVEVDEDDSHDPDFAPSLSLLESLGYEGDPYSVISWNELAAWSGESVESLRAREA